MRRDERLAARGDLRAKARVAMREVESGRGPRREVILRGVADELWWRDFRAPRGVPGAPASSPGGVSRGPWRPTHRLTFRPTWGRASVFHVGLVDQEPDEDGTVPAPTADEWARGADEVAWWTVLPRGWTYANLTGEERFCWNTSLTPHGTPGVLESALYGGRIPETPPEADQAAETLVRRVEAMNGVLVEALLLLVGSRDADTFGHVLAGATMSGVDPYPALGIRLPSARFLDLVLTMS